MVIERKQFELGLKAKGFERDASSGHIVYRYKVDGRFTSVTTHFSHTKKVKDISGGLLLQMRKQLRLDSFREVKNLVECPMSIEDYNQILRNKSII